MAALSSCAEGRSEVIKIEQQFGRALGLLQLRGTVWCVAARIKKCVVEALIRFRAGSNAGTSRIGQNAY